MKTAKERIALHRKDIPVSSLGRYDRAMTGKSRKAGVEAFCSECMGWVLTEVKHCTSPQCPLYPYRSVKVDASA